MKITKRFLQGKEACSEGIDWFVNQEEVESVDVVKKLVKENKLDWANWLVVRLMSYKSYVSYGIFAAEQVIKNYEKMYPNDKRPREAIKAAKKCLKSPTEKNKSAAYSAAYSAAHAAYSAAYSAVYSAAHAAYSAAHAADSAVYSAAHAAYSAAHAADSAADSAAYRKMRIKILKHGLKLIKGE